MNTDPAQDYFPFLAHDFHGWARSNPILQMLAQPPWLSLPSFSNIQFLGRGNFGCVLKFPVFHNGQQFSYALKFINNQGIGQHIAEVDNIIRIPHHPSIVKYYGSFQFYNYVVIAMESCDGSLRDFFQRYGDPTMPGFRQWQRSMRWKILKQVSEGLNECHRRDLMHRDIKPENILYVRNPYTNEFVFKLGDFGIARPALMPGQVGTINQGDPRYIAPEVKDPRLNGMYGLKVDIYSLGQLMGDVWAPDSSKWRQLQYQMTALDPSKRPSASEPRDIAEEALIKNLD